MIQKIKLTSKDKGRKITFNQINCNYLGKLLLFSDKSVVIDDDNHGVLIFNRLFTDSYIVFDDIEDEILYKLSR